MTPKRQGENKKGYIVISTVLILLFVTLGIAVTLAILSNGSSDVSRAVSLGQQALFSSDSCLEDALLSLKRDASYNGGTVEFPEGQCKIKVTNSEQIYTLDVYFSGQVKYTRSIEAQASFIEGNLKLTSWAQKPFVLD